MDNSFQTSFIPKKPITATGVSTRPPANISTIIASVVLIIVGASSAGLYLYKNYLVKQEQSLSSYLEKVRESFEQDTIDELALYDKRVSSSRKILDGHIVLSPMFTLLGTLTIPSIQYTKFNHETGPKGFTVRMSGVASDYKSIALQADVFNGAKGRFFKDVVFSNLVRDKSGNVTFAIEFTVDPALLSYEKNMVLEQIQAKAQAPEPTQATTPAPTQAPVTNEQPITN